jgi:uracil-DNA glycosylase
MAAVCRCFPGKKDSGGDRVPDPDEIGNCSGWLKAEMALLHPALVIAVGKLAIRQFMPCEKLDTVIGSAYPTEYAGHRFDLVPLPHPSGASPWPHQEPGRVLLPRALRLIAEHPAWRRVRAGLPG